jgi:hypothetical protein
VEEEMKENEAEESEDFFETIVANLEMKGNKSPADCWYLDSGATKHVLGDKSSFRGLKSSVKIWNVKLVGGQTHGVYGKRKMKLSSTSLKINIVSDVIYVLGFMKNLLSVGMIANKGHIVVFDSNKCFIIQNKDPDTIVVKNVKDPKNGLYKLQMHSIKSFEETQETYITKANVKESTNMDQHQTLFWHKRMVHLHY